MENEKAIEIFNKWMDCKDAYQADPSCDGNCFSCEYYASAEEEKEAMLFAISALEKQEQDRWIPVAEKQPELTHFMYDVTPFSDTVLVTVRNQYGAERLVLGNYEQRIGWNLELLNSTDERFQWHAIAWRPLPKAYQEDANAYNF